MLSDFGDSTWLELSNTTVFIVIIFTCPSYLRQITLTSGPTVPGLEFLITFHILVPQLSVNAPSSWQYLTHSWDHS